MLKILEFDFQDYPEAFQSTRSRLAEKIESFMMNGEIVLTVYHQALIITKT
jgi:hypothetical protein